MIIGGCGIGMVLNGKVSGLLSKLFVFGVVLFGDFGYLEELRESLGVLLFNRILVLKFLGVLM